MAKWIWDGYTKVHSSDRKRMIETWCWVCSECKNELRLRYDKVKPEPYSKCPKCGAVMDK